MELSRGRFPAHRHQPQPSCSMFGHRCSVPGAPPTPPPHRHHSCKSCYVLQSSACHVRKAQLFSLLLEEDHQPLGPGGSPQSWLIKGIERPVACIAIRLYNRTNCLIAWNEADPGFCSKQLGLSLKLARLPARNFPMSEKLTLEKKSANLIPRLSASILQNFSLLKVTFCDGQS